MRRSNLTVLDRTPPGRRRGVLSVFMVTAALMVSAAAEAKKIAPTPLETVQMEPDEASLLDVGIEVFNPGLPAGDLTELEEEGIFEDVREAEARFFALRLVDTLQSTGYWGAVRISPLAAGVSDLQVSGTIVESSGMLLELEIEAYDSRGEKWLDKSYRQVADETSYRDDFDSRVDDDEDPFSSGVRPDPFQSLYNTIANDLRRALHGVIEKDGKSRRSSKPRASTLEQIRRVTEMRFAADLAPEIYDSHLGHDRKGRYEVIRLPADGDPQIERVRDIRDRDYLFVDTVSEHYANFSARMQESYDQWRLYSFEEEVVRRKIQRQARNRKIAGAVAILGAILVGGDSRSASAAREVAVIGGIEAIRSGISKAQEAKLHRETLRELAASFDSEISPTLVEVEGQTLKLSGSVEAQYAEWRRLLRQLFAEETGFSLDPNSGEINLKSLPGEVTPAVDSAGEDAADDTAVNPAVKEAAVDETQVIEPLPDEAKADDPWGEQPPTVDPWGEQPTTDDPWGEQPQAGDATNTPQAEDPVAEDPVAEDPVAEDPAAEAPNSRSFGGDL